MAREWTKLSLSIEAGLPDAVRMGDGRSDRRRRLIARPEDFRALIGGMARASREMLAIGYLDPDYRLAGMRLGYSLHCSMIDLPVRRIVADALALECAGIVLAHNHPGGDPTPSAADLAATADLARVAKAVQLVVIDHLVLAADAWVSFRERGFL